MSATERLDLKEALTMNPTTPVATHPMGQAFPVGHHAPRRTIDSDLASALWTARANSRLLNRDAARLIGIDPSYLSKLVRGTRCPSSVVAERLIAFLPLTEDQQVALRDISVPDHGKSFRPR